MTDGIKAVKCALVSVSDKTGIIEFAQFLHVRGIKILSTGGTAKLLADNGVAVTQVSDHTGFPEMMDGRVKTLHPKIHGGILGRRGQDDQVMSDNRIEAIDLVVVNLYPFEQTIAAGGTDSEAIENIDIGGPAMIRSAAKNHNDVTVAVDAADYSEITRQITAHGGTDLKLRRYLAAKVFAHTARYDGLISNYLNQGESSLPAVYSMQYRQIMPMRYGENPHQQAAFYQQHHPEQGSLAAASLLQGKALSYNNVADADAALECVKEFDQPACVIVKHANPVVSQLPAIFQRPMNWPIKLIRHPLLAESLHLTANSMHSRQKRSSNGSLSRSLSHRRFMNGQGRPSAKNQTSGCWKPVIGPGNRRRHWNTSVSAAAC